MRSPRPTRQHGPANVFHAGHTRARPKPGHSQAHPGVAPLGAISHRNTSFQPLPRPLDLPPYHYSLVDKFPDIGDNITRQKKQIFHVVGDTGGVKDGEFQDNVAEHMIDQLTSNKGGKPLFCYHVGDVVYFTGSRDDYYAQFYEPYANYDVPIFSIPGNHDGEVDDPSEQTSLDGWVDYFMQEHPDVDPISKDAPRVQLDLPNVYWTFVRPLATIIGMYTNVPEHGSIDSTQQQWLTHEFATAPEDRALILALHHPIYSFDAFHSGSSRWRMRWKTPFATPDGCRTSFWRAMSTTISGSSRRSVRTRSRSSSPAMAATTTCTRLPVPSAGRRRTRAPC